MNNIIIYNYYVLALVESQYLIMKAQEKYLLFGVCMKLTGKGSIANILTEEEELGTHDQSARVCTRESATNNQSTCVGTFSMNGLEKGVNTMGELNKVSNNR